MGARIGYRAMHLMRLNGSRTYLLPFPSVVRFRDMWTWLRPWQECNVAGDLKTRFSMDEHWERYTHEIKKRFTTIIGNRLEKRASYLLLQRPKITLSRISALKFDSKFSHSLQIAGNRDLVNVNNRGVCMVKTNSSIDKSWNDGRSHKIVTVAGAQRFLSLGNKHTLDKISY